MLRPSFETLIPFAFPLLWLATTAFLGLLSGWYGLMQRYPDHAEQPLLTLKWQSGRMGFGVSLNNVLRLSACPSGLRVGIFRLFGPFSRDFFVPWEVISITRRKYFFAHVAELQFGTPPNGTLVLQAKLADKLAQAARESWPEKPSGI
jgi:hypothetical protein